MICHHTHNIFWMKLGQQMTLNDIPLDPTEFCLPQKGPRRTFWPRQNGDATTGCEPAKNGTRRSAEGLMVPGLGWILRKTLVLIVENGGKWWSTQDNWFWSSICGYIQLETLLLYVRKFYVSEYSGRDITLGSSKSLYLTQKKRRNSGFIMVMICYTHLPTQNLYTRFTTPRQIGSIRNLNRLPASTWWSGASATYHSLHLLDVVGSVICLQHHQTSSCHCFWRVQSCNLSIVWHWGHFDFSHSLGMGKGYFEQGSIPFCCTKFIPARYHQTQESRSWPWNRSWEEQLVRWVWTSLRNTELLAAILCLLRVIMRILSTKTSQNYHSRSRRVEAPNNSENCWRVQKGGWTGTDATYCALLVDLTRPYPGLIKGFTRPTKLSKWFQWTGQRYTPLLRKPAGAWWFQALRLPELRVPRMDSSKGGGLRSKVGWFQNTCEKKEFGIEKVHCSANSSNFYL